MRFSKQQAIIRGSTAKNLARMPWSIFGSRTDNVQRAGNMIF
jgi:hypothetical protein